MYHSRTADGMLVTGQNPQSSEETAKNLLNTLTEPIGEASWVEI